MQAKAEVWPWIIAIRQKEFVVCSAFRVIRDWVISKTTRPYYGKPLITLNKMQPDFAIYADEQDITKEMLDRNVHFELHDHAGLKNDRLNITIDDRALADGQYVKFPPRGTKFTAFFGYLAATNQDVPISGAGLKKMGIYVMDEIKFGIRETGRSMTLCGHSIFMEGTFLMPRTRSYHNRTVDQIVKEVTERNGLRYVIDPAIKDYAIDHVVQNTESDASFLYRFTSSFGGTYKLINGVVYIAYQGNMVLLAAAAGVPGVTDNQAVLNQRTSGLQTTLFERADVWNFEYHEQGRGSYKGVRAKFYDLDKAERAYTEFEPTPDDGSDPDGAGGGTTAEEDRIMTLVRTYPNEDEARRAAKARVDQLAKTIKSLSFSCIGDATLRAEGGVEFDFTRPGVPTIWRIMSVVHSLTEQGYECHLDCELPIKPGSVQEQALINAEADSLDNNQNP